MKEDKGSHAYWKATLGLLTKILIIWFVVSFGAGILFADMLNNIKLGGYPLGVLVCAPGLHLHLHCADFLLRQEDGRH
jgi:putative solute:sodium symporter small subunit